MFDLVLKKLTSLGLQGKDVEAILSSASSLTQEAVSFLRNGRDLVAADLVISCLILLGILVLLLSQWNLHRRLARAENLLGFTELPANGTTPAADGGESAPRRFRRRPRSADGALGHLAGQGGDDNGRAGKEGRGR